MVSFYNDGLSAIYDATAFPGRFDSPEEVGTMISARSDGIFSIYIDWLGNAKPVPVPSTISLILHAKSSFILSHSPQTVVFVKQYTMMSMEESLNRSILMKVDSSVGFAKSSEFKI